MPTGKSTVHHIPSVFFRSPSTSRPRGVVMIRVFRSPSPDSEIMTSGRCRVTTGFGCPV